MNTGNNGPGTRAVLEGRESECVPPHGELSVEYDDV